MTSVVRGNLELAHPIGRYHAPLQERSLLQKAPLARCRFQGHGRCQLGAVVRAILEATSRDLKEQRLSKLRCDSACFVLFGACAGDGLNLECGRLLAMSSY